jgi:glyoxylase-like metal-dependent hydrolase (beta-lactamase superfamily II)
MESTMTNYICVTCGTQYARTDSPPDRCSICEDDRQYIGPEGQKWTTLDDMRPTHKNLIDEDEPSLVGITTEPTFAIGQRARLVVSPKGNMLWECLSFIDQATVEAVRARGGISAIAISHPHFYSSIAEWSEAFDNAPIYLHEDNRRWVMRPHPNIVFWSGERRELGDGLTLVRCGGHFPGSSVLHWAGGAGGKGVLLTGDTIYVVSDRRYVSFMYSYPNLIPLNTRAVRRIVGAVEPLEYDRIYSSWKERVINSGAKEAVRRSAERYITAIQDTPD